MTTTIIGLIIGAASAFVLLVLWRIAERVHRDFVPKEEQRSSRPAAPQANVSPVTGADDGAA